MEAATGSKLFRGLAGAAGAALLLFFHLMDLGTQPGLHFDEAWAMNYSWRIASESGFWPLTAMSPYTAPWAHYFAALFLKVLGSSLYVFRLSQVSLSLTGLLFLALALPRRARAIFPWACLLLPGLLLNHRFPVELTGFHVLAFGLSCFALSRRWWWLAVFSVFAGATAHILFYGALLGFAAALVLAPPKNFSLDPKMRRALVGAFFLLALFFLKVALQIPEKGKGAALVVSALLAGVFFLLKGEEKVPFRLTWVSLTALPVLSAVFLFNALFFGQGYWSASVYTGLDVWSLYPGFAPPNFLWGLFALALVSVLAIYRAPPFQRVWFFASTFFLGLMMLKPAPRYFELVFLGLTALLSCWLASDPVERGRSRFELPSTLRGMLFLAVAFGFFALNFFNNLEMTKGLFDVAQLVRPRDSALRFLFFKDSSRDFLDKQGLAAFLGSSGCKLSDIETHDPRLLEALRALSLGDWPVDDKKRCEYSYVARASEDGASGESFGEFLIKRKGQ